MRIFFGIITLIGGVFLIGFLLYTLINEGWPDFNFWGKFLVIATFVFCFAAEYLSIRALFYENSGLAKIRRQNQLLKLEIEQKQLKQKLEDQNKQSEK